MLIFSLLIAYIYFLVKIKVDDVDGAYNCPICQQPSVKEVIGCGSMYNAWGSKKNCPTQKVGFVAFAGNKINFTIFFCFLV